MKAPKYGYCACCGEGIVEGEFWTFTKHLYRVHHEVDICVVNNLKKRGYYLSKDGRRWIKARKKVAA